VRVILIIGLGTGYFSVLTGLAVSGLGTGLMFPNLNVWLTSEMPENHERRAVGGLTTAIFLGQFISPVAGQPLTGLFGTGILFIGTGAFMLLLAIVFTLLAIIPFLQYCSLFLFPRKGEIWRAGGRSRFY
jgi:MFS family permease